jgi:hypothetical protein
MPDFFEGEPANITWYICRLCYEGWPLNSLRYPPVSEEQKNALYSWFPSRVPTTGVVKIPKVLAEVEATYGKKDWAALGV